MSIYPVPSRTSRRFITPPRRGGFSFPVSAKGSGPAPGSEAPRVTSAKAISGSSVLLTFDQPMANDAVLRAPESYELDAGPGVVQVQPEGTTRPVWVLLVFATPLVPDQNYILSVVGALTNADEIPLDPSHTSAPFTGTHAEDVAFLEDVTTYASLRDSILQSNGYGEEAFTQVYSYSRVDIQQSQELFFEERAVTRALMSERIAVSNTYVMTARDNAFMYEFVGDLHSPAPEPRTLEEGLRSVVLAVGRASSQFEATESRRSLAYMWDLVVDEQAKLEGVDSGVVEEYPRTYAFGAGRATQRFEAAHRVVTHARIYDSIQGSEAPLRWLIDNAFSFVYASERTVGSMEIHESASTNALVRDRVYQDPGGGGIGPGAHFNRGFN